MTRITIPLARVGLVVLMAVAGFGVLDPDHDARRFTLRPDFVEHTLYAYAITLLAIVALPKVMPWMIVAAIVGVGLLAEATQLLHLLAGAGQWHDLASNLLGSVAAAGPFALGRRLAVR